MLIKSSFTGRSKLRPANYNEVHHSATSGLNEQHHPILKMDKSPKNLNCVIYMPVKLYDLEKHIAYLEVLLLVYTVKAIRIQNVFVKSKVK